MSTTLMATTPRLNSEIEEILGLHEMSEEDLTQFIETVGSLVIESAVLKFIVSIMPGEREIFELWLENHRQDNDLLESAREAYPLFAEIFDEEITTFQAETRRLFGS